MSTRGSVITAALVLVVVLVGALVGSLLASASPTSAAATVTLALQPDAQVSGDPNRTMADPSSDDSSFLQRELVYLGGTELASAVRKRTGVDSTLTATQVAQSSVVALSATAPTRAQAVRAVTDAQTVYAQRRERAATSTLDKLADETQLQITAVRTSLKSADARAVAGVTDGQTTALQSRYANLLALAGSIEFVRQTVGDGVTVIQTPTAAASSGVSRSVLGAGFGALVGLLLCLAALVLRRRVDPRVSSAADVGESGAVVISPLTPRMGADWPKRLVPVSGRAPTRVDRSIALQSAQLLPQRDPGLARSLVLVGVTPGAGSSAVAAHHAAVLARRRPTLLICAADVAGADLASQLGADSSSRGLAGLQDVSLGLGPDDVRAAATTSSVPGLSLLAAGSGSDVHGLELLAERGLVRAARDAGWHVVVDAPALSLSSAAMSFARDADALALGVSLGRTRPEDVDGAISVLDAAGVAVSGVLLHHPEGRSPRKAGREGVERSGTSAAVGGHSRPLPAASAETMRPQDARSAP